MTRIKASVRSLSISPNPETILVTLDSPDFKQLTSLVIEIPKDEKLSLGDELVLVIEKNKH